MSDFTFSLEPYRGMNTRYICPKCKSNEKTFVHYVNNSTGEYLNSIVGRCNREINCGYHYTPKEFFQNYPATMTNKPITKNISTTIMKKEASNSISVIPTRLIEDSLHRGVSINELAIKNNFISYLNKTLGLDYSNEFVAKYFIGTSDHWSGATIFWQVDISGKIRAGKVILYDETTGKRIKSPFNHIHWIHRINNIENFEMRQCFFGEHLLKDETRPVAIVESEKTAVIASSYIPEFIWLAAGSRDGLNEEKCKVLSGRSVVLFPDLNCLEHWENKAEELSHFANFFVSDFLELMASKEHKELGLDLADYLVTNRPDDFKAKKKNTSKNGFCVTFPYEADIHQQQNFKQVKTQIQAEKMDIVYSAKSIPADTTDNGNLHISVGEDIANLLPEEQVKSSITKIINN